VGWLIINPEAVPEEEGKKTINHRFSSNPSDGLEEK
jgi:hypothetical protein